MKITEIVCQLVRIPSVEKKTASSQDSVLVRIRTDNGLEGIGEADSQPEVVKAIIDAPFSHNVAASLHWLCTCRDAFIFEDCVEDSPLRHQLTVEPVQAVDGWITVPDRPGLGVTLNEKFIADHLVTESGRK